MYKESDILEENSFVNDIESEQFTEEEIDYREYMKKRQEKFKQEKSYSFVLPLIQITICAAIFLAMLGLKNINLEWFRIARDWYSTQMNESLIAGSDLKNQFESNLPTMSGLKSKLPFKKAKTEVIASAPSLVNLSVALANPLDSGIITSEFGERKHPITKKESFHKGLDIAAKKGSLVRCVLAGVVEEAGANGGAGNSIIVNHGNGIKSKYFHCGEILARQNDLVSRDQPIAKVDDTGISTGSHLHIELIINDKNLDPKAFIRGKYV